MRRGWRPAAAMLVVSLWVATPLACSDGSSHLLAVDLRTDYEPGSEFTRIATEVRPLEASEDRTRILRESVRPGGDYLAGERVAEVEVDATGDYVVRTSLRRADGSLVASRTLHARVERSVAVTVVVTRSCEGVSCPAPGDPESSTTCVGGRCVDPECSPERPAACGDLECSSDAECSAEVSCAEAVCADGYCLERGRDVACPPDERCDVARGCVPDDADGGVRDAGTADAGCTPSTESCNERDDDCDGEIDETFDLSSDPDHCGTCDNICRSWQLCSERACAVDPSQLEDRFCPSDPLSRAEAAVFLVKWRHGRDAYLADATGVFDDVPPSAVYAKHVEQLYRDGIVTGCSATEYCPDDLLTRGQAAVLLVRARYGPSFDPPDATGVFDDVPPGGVYAGYIEQLYRDGVVNGCSATQYCPDDPLTRAQMAVMLVRLEYGAGYTPPPAEGLFDDVAPGDFFAPHVEQLARDGAVTGCAG